MFFKIGVLKNFVILTEKHLCWSLFLIKLTPKTPKRLQHRYFLVNIAKFLRTPFLRKTSGGCFCCFKKFVHSQENIRLITKVGPGIRDPPPETLHQRPGTHTWDTGLRTFTWDPRPGTETRDPIV